MEGSKVMKETMRDEDEKTGVQGVKIKSEGCPKA